MGRYQIKKDSTQAKFFAEFLLFRQKYYNGESDESFWEEVKNEAKKITDKYEDEDFGDFARMIVLDHLADVQNRFYGKGC